VKTLVLNCGSSSIKYKLFNGLEAIDGGIVSEVEDFHGPIEQILQKYGEHVDAVAHRVVHGGEEFRESALVDEQVIAAIRRLIPLAPLHNPYNLDGIITVQRLLPTIPQVAVFDTAFHQSMPKSNYLYAIDYALYQEHRIRKYGFHGTSHRYVAKQAAKLLGKALEEVNLITLHLGNGCSMCAIKNGRSINTTMGFTPLEGLVMGTRSGDIDPSIIFYLLDKGWSQKKIENLLNKESGLKGVCKKSDLRAILSEESELSKLAVDIMVHRARKYLGAYWFELGGEVDAIVFTAGVGENAPIVREKIVENLEALGILIDQEANARNGTKISKSTVDIMVIPTNEELEIVQEAHRLTIKA
jgi:acetate kinase